MDKYHVEEIHYRDIYGSLLWKDPMVFKRLHAVGEEIIEKGKPYIVKRVAVADNIQHVNIVKGEVPKWTCSRVRRED